MDRDGRKIKLDPEVERKVVAAGVNKINDCMPEGFEHLDPGMTTLPELLNALIKTTALGLQYYAQLKTLQDEFQGKSGKDKGL